MPEPDDLTRVMLALRPPVEVMVDDATGGHHGSALFEPQPEHRGNPGWLHGGLAATLLDHTCARVAAAALNGHVVTGRLDLRYPRPVVLAGGPYRVVADSQRSRGRMVRVTGAILDEDGAALVEAKALFVLLPTA